MATFVLVHGALHGGWCWYKVVSRLRHLRHTVFAPDLPGHGTYRSTPYPPTYRDYVRRVVEVLETCTEPVILVGHSMGGGVVAGVAEAIPDKIAKLVFLCAILPQSGKSINESAPPDTVSLVPAYSTVGATQDIMVFDHEGLRPTFYADCSDDDVALAKLLLTPQSLEPLSVPIATSNERFGRIARVYIECTQDAAISLAQQRAMVEKVPCDEVITLETSHSPFFSAPDLLTSVLAGLAR